MQRVLAKTPTASVQTIRKERGYLSMLLNIKKDVNKMMQEVDINR
jgi:hypothetical protein